MMDKDNKAPTGSNSAKRTADRRVKFIFFAVVLVAASIVYYSQRSGPTLPGWGDNLTAALKRGQQDNRPVLVLFYKSLSGDAVWDLKKHLGRIEADKALADGKFIRVKVKLTSGLDSTLAKTHQIRKLPTILIIGPDGKERNRRVGRIPYNDFWNGFLNGSTIQEPGDG